MEIQLLINELIEALQKKAAESLRLRSAFDLRTTPADMSQRILNVLEPSTMVPIHKHDDTDETVLCLEGKLTYILLKEEPYDVKGGPKDVYSELSNFKEVMRFMLDPTKGQYGAQVPKGVWHTIEVKERCTIFEAKDGAYKPA